MDADWHNADGHVYRMAHGRIPMVELETEYIELGKEKYVGLVLETDQQVEEFLSTYKETKQIKIKVTRVCYCCLKNKPGYRKQLCETCRIKNKLEYMRKWRAKNKYKLNYAKRVQYSKQKTIDKLKKRE